ncbi:MAG: hypothetical protein ABEI74_00170 [Candidatus Pacearchaeota archaeon]
MDLRKYRLSNLKEASLSGIHSLFEGIGKIFESIGGLFYMAQDPYFYERSYFGGGLEQDRQNILSDWERLNGYMGRAMNRAIDWEKEYQKESNKHYQESLSRESFMSNKDLTKKLSQKEVHLN